MHPNVHCSIVYNSQDTDVTWMSIDRGLDTEVAVYYSAITNNGIRPFAATWVDLEGVILSE